jgi:hypothetical protein
MVLPCSFVHDFHFLLKMSKKHTPAQKLEDFLSEFRTVQHNNDASASKLVSHSPFLFPLNNIIFQQ